jgi:hypothetical protein
MKKRMISIVSAAAVVVMVIGCSESNDTPKNPLKSLRTFDAGGFTIDKPNNWYLKTAGDGSSLGFVVCDPNKPMRRAFYFGTVGPVYMSQQQKQIDNNYVQMGGYPNSWMDMPVVQPLTPENFIMQIPYIARTQLAQRYMPEFPKLDNFQVISSTPQPSHIQGGTTSLIRGVFQEGNQVCEGMFLLTVAPYMPFMNGPGGGTCVGTSFIGITAPKNEFANYHAGLKKIVGSFNIKPEYLQRCLANQKVQWQGVIQAGKTLSETSDIIMNGWTRRNKTDDIIAAKRSDAMLEKERLYNPDTNKVYEFRSGFYEDHYQNNRNRYEMSNLQQLPANNHTLWNTATLNGAQELH